MTLLIYYETVAVTTSMLINSALALLTQKEQKENNEKDNGVTVANTTSFDREEIVELPDGFSSVQNSFNGKPLGIIFIYLFL